jgi:hypothetical protein
LPLLLLLLLQSLFKRLVVLLELATCEAADTAAEAAAAAAEAGSTPPAAAAGPGPSMQRLEQVVDECHTLIYLANCHNHLPMFQSIAWNLETGELGAASPAHRLRVAKRMELTSWQVRESDKQQAT